MSSKAAYKFVIIPTGMKIAGKFGELTVTDHLPDNIKFHPSFVDRLCINQNEEVSLHHDGLASNMRFMRPFPEPDGHPCWRPVWQGHSCIRKEDLYTLRQLIYDHMHLPLAFDAMNRRWYIDESGFKGGEYYRWYQCSI